MVKELVSEFRATRDQRRRRGLIAALGYLALTDEMDILLEAACDSDAEVRAVARMDIAPSIWDQGSEVARIDKLKKWLMTNKNTDCAIAALPVFSSIQRALLGRESVETPSLVEYSQSAVSEIAKKHPSPAVRLEAAKALDQLREDLREDRKTVH